MYFLPRITDRLLLVQFIKLMYSHFVALASGRVFLCLGFGDLTSVLLINVMKYNVKPSERNIVPFSFFLALMQWDVRALGLDVIEYKF